MSLPRRLAALAFFLGAAAVLAGVADLALTPSDYDALCAFGRACIENLVVQAVLITLAFVGLISLCACAWERAERRYEERTK